MPTTIDRALSVLAAVQILLGLRVVVRLMRPSRPPISVPRGTAVEPILDRVSIVVPVLDEFPRLGPCLDGLIAQGAEVREILVVDGGSSDGTGELVRQAAARDKRIRLLHANPTPPGWNGKAWGLRVGLTATCPESSWVLMVDADVRPTSHLTQALIAKARGDDLSALSVATPQQATGLAEGMLHPALLATLVYRFGRPGRVYTRVHDVQANGQCFLARRDVLMETDAIGDARGSRCEDVTMARGLVALGVPVGFYEAPGLVATRMYDGWRETWQNWPRSLPMRDRYARYDSLVRLLEVMLVQAAPSVLLLLNLYRFGVGRWHWILGIVNGLLAVLRVGVLVGMRRAYTRVAPTYWLSPLCDLPAVLALLRGTVRRRHVWRGRDLVKESYV